MPSKRTAVIGAVVAVAAGGIVGGALAASGAFDPQAERQAFLNDAAGRLGTTSDKLEAALKAAAIDRVDAALAAGRITADQAQKLKDAINAGKLPAGPGLGLGGGGFGRFGGGFGPGKLYRVGFLSAAATYLGLSQADLQTQLQSGKSLADVAKAQGKSVDGLKQAILSSEQSALDQAVKDGRLTSAQRDKLLADFKSRLDDLVNRTRQAPQQGQGAFRDGFRFAPGGFARPLPAERSWGGLATA
jgi:hypothetical protein